MLEILYKLNQAYPLGHLQTFDIQVGISDRTSDFVIKEDVAFIEQQPGMYGLQYLINGQVKKELENILVAPVNHLNDYIDYLIENVSYIKLNGATLFDCNNFEDVGGDEDAADSNEPVY